jgi:hypothetical protein
MSATPNYWKKLDISNLAADGELISTPGENRRIVLIAVTCSVAMNFKETNTSGDVICHLGAGMNRFPAPIYVSANTAIHAEDIHGTAGNVTAFYYTEALDGV